MKKRKTVTIIGLGYVGLPVLESLVLADTYHVYGLDVNQDLIAKLQQQFGDNAVITNNASLCLPNADYVIVCVPTPIDGRKKPDLKAVNAVFNTIAEYLHRGQHIIIESTVYPGFCEQELLPILEKKSRLKGGRDFHFSHCPERINPGDPVWHVRNIPRNMGSLTQSGAKQARNFYQSFLPVEIAQMGSIKEAEATKIVENVFRDVNIAFANELAISFDKLGIDAPKVISAAASKPFSFLAHYPGCGVGGDCIATDPYYYLQAMAAVDCLPKLSKTARQINEAMPEYIWQKAQRKLQENKQPISSLKYAILGLAYKPETSDMRNSPGLALLKILQKAGVGVVTHDPYVGGAVSSHSLDLVLQEVDVLFICTAHREYLQKLTAKKLSQKAIRLVVDGRNCLNKLRIEQLGITYIGVGR